MITNKQSLFLFVLRVSKDGTRSFMEMIMVFDQSLGWLVDIGQEAGKLEEAGLVRIYRNQHDVHFYEISQDGRAYVDSLDVHALRTQCAPEIERLGFLDKLIEKHRSMKVDAGI